MFSLGCARLGLIFYLFLFGFCRANFFSFVAQAATGISLLVPPVALFPGLEGLVTCCFFTGFCARCLFASRALCVRSSVLFWLSVCLFRAGCTRIFLLIFYLLLFSCLTSSSQTSFHLSLRPRRASTFFRKESRQRFAKGLRPFEPHSCALRVDLPFPRAAGRLKRPFGPQTRRQIRETLEKPRSRAQLFKRFCAKGDACALSLLSPFFWLLAGLTALRAAIRRLIRETPKKPRSKAQLFGRFCALGNVWPHIFLIYGSLGRAFALPQGTGDRLLPGPGKQKPGVGLHPEKTACVRGLAQAKNTVRELPTAGARGRSRQSEPLCRQPNALQAANAGDEPAVADSPAPGRRSARLCVPGAAARIAHRR